jgi:hypothetical protein
MAENKKPTDFLEKFADKDFQGTVGLDVADVPQTTDKEGLLFTPNDPPPESDDTFTWTEDPKIVEKFGQGMYYSEAKSKSGKTFRYYGKTRTDVTRQLLKAQSHATDKIEEFSSRPAPTTPAPYTPPANIVPDTRLPYDPVPRKSSRQLSQDEIIRLNELQQSDPVQAYRIVFEATTGYTPEGFAEVTSRSDSMYARRIADEAAFQFQANHAEDDSWDPTPGNSALIDAYLKERKWPATLNNFEIAYQDLSRQNRLTKPKPEAADATAPPVSDSASQVEEIFEPPPPPVSVPSGSAPSPARERQPGPSREEAASYQTMPLDQLRSAITDKLRQQRSGSR